MEQPIIGHQQIIEQLRHSIQSNRVAGAYLFVGVANVGKETVALYFAKSMNCLEPIRRPNPPAFPPTPTPPREGREGGDFSPLPDPSDREEGTGEGFGACGHCLSCRKIDNGNHPDVQIIRPAGTWMKIDQIRELQKRIVYRPLEGKQKVYILTEVERMNLEAANCLLKTLEEPPAASVLILLTTNLDALLPTMRSRCQIIHFHPLPIAELAAYLLHQFDIEEARAFSIATLSGGAVGKALTFQRSHADRNAPEHRGRGNESILDEEIPEILTATDRLAAFRIAEKLSQNPDALDHLVTWYRDVLLLHQGASIDLMTHTHHVEALKQLAPHYSRLHLQSAIKTILETKNLIKRNVNATLALEVMVLKLLRC